ncbi:MAG TPA: DUF2231 domain-containing protein, partial [Methylophilaceae bacterium]|nr:DUF2231 domain-containing protein [Methylophilaceae bacterium]
MNGQQVGPETAQQKISEQGIARQGVIAPQSIMRYAGICAPLHPIFVHFSIALTASSFGFDLLGYFIIEPVF